MNKISFPDEVPFRVTNPERIPTPRYYDEAFFRLEGEHVWPHVWQMACRLEQIQKIGDWAEYSNLGNSVIIVRTNEGIKAFHNVCRHRGVKLAQESHGNCQTKGFICPFHGWRWNMEGKNTFVYGKHMFSEAQLDTADIALKPCRMEIAIGCVFINFDDNAPSLRDSIGPLIDKLEVRNFSKLRAEWWFATVLPANWKIAMEAFMEGYHVMRTHPQLYQVLPAAYAALYGQLAVGAGNATVPESNLRDTMKARHKQWGLLNKGMAGQIAAKEVDIIGQMLDVELPEDKTEAMKLWLDMIRDEITKQLRARGEPVPDLNEVNASHPVNAVEFLFPHYFVLPVFTSAASYRIRPLGPESCLFELWSLTMYPEGEEPAPPMEPTMLPYDSDQFPDIPRQDYGNIPYQQKGLHIGGFDFMRLAKNGEGLISNYQRIIDGYMAGADPEKLAAAVQTLAGNFNGPIINYDF